MSGTSRRKFIDYERNSRWAKVALQACSLHDRLMDCLKIYYGLDVDIGCRAALEVDVRPGIRKMEELYRNKPRELPVIEAIEGFVQRQRLDPENLIDSTVLQRMKDMFIQFIDNESFEIASTEAYGMPQLMIRSLESLPRSTRLTGLGFICFPLPDSEETPHDLERHFDDASTFVTPADIRHVQLGPAALFNHHCEADKRNVEQFGKPNSSKGLKGIATVYQPTLTRAVAAGEEMLSDYGDTFFDDIDSVCKCSKVHQRTKTRRNKSINRSTSVTRHSPPPKRSYKRKQGSTKPSLVQADTQDFAYLLSQLDRIPIAERAAGRSKVPRAHHPDPHIPASFPEPTFHIGLKALRDERARAQKQTTISQPTVSGSVSTEQAAHSFSIRPVSALSIGSNDIAATMARAVHVESGKGKVVKREVSTESSIATFVKTPTRCLGSSVTIADPVVNHRMLAGMSDADDTVSAASVTVGSAVGTLELSIDTLDWSSCHTASIATKRSDSPEPHLMAGGNIAAYQQNHKSVGEAPRQAGREISSTDGLTGHNITVHDDIDKSLVGAPPEVLVSDLCAASSSRTHEGINSPAHRGCDSSGIRSRLETPIPGFRSGSRDGHGEPGNSTSTPLLTRSMSSCSDELYETTTPLHSEQTRFRTDQTATPVSPTVCDIEEEDRWLYEKKLDPRGDRYAIVTCPTFSKVSTLEFDEDEHSMDLCLSDDES